MFCGSIYLLERIDLNIRNFGIKLDLACNTEALEGNMVVPLQFRELLSTSISAARFAVFLA